MVTTNSTRSALALSYPSWTGEVEVTPAVGSTTTVRPRAGDSVGSFMQRVVAQLALRTPAAWSWRVDASARVVLSSSAQFDWLATGEVATRTALGDTSSTDGQIVGAGAAAGVYVPDGGAAATPEVAAVGGVPTGTGAEGTPPRPSAAGALSVVGAPGGEVEESVAGVCDVVGPDGRVWHRHAVAGWVRTYPGRQAGEVAELAADGSPVETLEVPW